MTRVAAIVPARWSTFCAEHAGFGRSQKGSKLAKAWLLKELKKA